MSSKLYKPKTCAPCRTVKVSVYADYVAQQNVGVNVQQGDLFYQKQTDVNGEALFQLTGGPASVWIEDDQYTGYALADVTIDQREEEEAIEEVTQDTRVTSLRWGTIACARDYPNDTPLEVRYDYFWLKGRILINCLIDRGLADTLDPGIDVPIQGLQITDNLGNVYTSDANGIAEVVLEAGTYTFQITGGVPADHELTFLFGDSDPENDFGNLDIVAGVTRDAFIGYTSNKGQIRIFCVDDVNRNNTYEPGIDQPLAGIEVSISEDGSSNLTPYTSDANGTIIVSLTKGVYWGEITGGVPDDYELSFLGQEPTDDPNNNRFQFIIQGADQITDFNLGFQYKLPILTITALVEFDALNAPQPGAGEAQQSQSSGPETGSASAVFDPVLYQPVAGVQITMDGQVNPAKVTNAEGKVGFALQTGEHTYVIESGQPDESVISHKGTRFVSGAESYDSTVNFLAGEKEDIDHIYAFENARGFAELRAVIFAQGGTDPTNPANTGVQGLTVRLTPIDAPGGVQGDYVTNENGYLVGSLWEGVWEFSIVSGAPAGHTLTYAGNEANPADDVFQITISSGTTQFVYYGFTPDP